jgi:MFS family permease
VLFTRAFVTTLLAMFAYSICQGILQPELPHYVADRLHGNGLQVGVVVGAFTVTAITLRSAAGRLADRRGSRLVIRLGLVVATLSILLYNLADTLPQLVGCRLLTGVGEAAAYVGLAKLAYDLAPSDRKAEATSYFTVAVFGGFAIGPILGESLRRSHGFHAVWIVASAFAFASLVIGIWLEDAPVSPQPAASPAEEAVRRPWRKTFIQRDAAGPATILLLAMIGYSALTTFVPLYVTHLGLPSAGPVLAETAVIILLVRLFGAKLPDRVSPLRSATASLALQAVGWGMLAGWHSSAGLYLGDVFIALGVSLLYPSLFTVAVHRAPASEQGNAVATFTMAFDLANGVGALLLGAVVTISGHEPAAFAAASIFNVAGLALIATHTNWVQLRGVAETPALAGA